MTFLELEQAARAVDPSVVFVLPRVLRRVIREHCGLPGLGIKVPHRKTYVIQREPLLEIVDPVELGLKDRAAVPEQVILLPRPDEEWLAAASAGEALVWCWRLLLHAKVDAAMKGRAVAGYLSAPAVRQRICQLGPTQFDEIRMVLAQEAFLLPPRDDRTVYAEFAAVYLELKYFAPSFLAYYFPALESTERVDQVLAQDLDAEELFVCSQPRGAPDPVDPLGRAALDEDAADEGLEAAEEPAAAITPSKERYRRLVRRAEEAATTGNSVRAAICRAQAEPYAPAESCQQAQAALKADVDRLIRRLLVALEAQDRDPRPWQEPLLALARQAPHGIWTPEARLLYDLQKVCVDHERDISTVDVVEWGLSLGKRPVKRPLPNQRQVLISKHLRSAARRLATVRLADGHRRRLSKLLRAAANWAEERLRDRFRPLIAQTLEEVGLRPRNVPERVARRKLVEEMLDRIVERGFLTMGDLRDALSRNGLKLPDGSGPADLLGDDQLLRADRRLAWLLDGVYERGEVYLRWMQRLSSWAFGTKVGRFLTRHLAVPFGGAFLVLAGLDHLIALIAKLALGAEAAEIVREELVEAGAAGHAVKLTAHAGEFFEIPLASRLLQVLMVGFFLWGLIHVEDYRKLVWRILKTSCRTARDAVIDATRWLLRLPWMRIVLQSRQFRMAMRFVVKPLAYTAVAWFALPFEHIPWSRALPSGMAIFVAVNALLNSRAGRELEEMATDWLVQAWHRVGVRVLTSLFWLVMDLFKGLLQAIERVLYTVDEWLRFRSGEGRASLVGKAILGVAWFYVTYAIRFCVNLLIEPQINPIKHFPVVTVSHKLLLPFIPALGSVLALTMEKGLALTAATAIITAIPGIIGFLVWELKENWRLYDANRPQRLGPVAVGSHGETMPRLLRPGLHSGTLPKRYAKLRRAGRSAPAKGNWRAVRQHLQALEHAELGVRRFVQRELVALLAESRAWQAQAVAVGEVHASANRLTIALGFPHAPTGLRIAFEAQCGWVLADVIDDGWLARLSASQRDALRTAILGLYKLAGVELIHRQVAAAFPAPAAFAMDHRGLVVWPESSRETEVRYDLKTEGSLAIPVAAGPLPRGTLTLDRHRLVFAEVRVSWQDWVQVWQREQADEATAEAPAGRVLRSVRVLED